MALVLADRVQETGTANTTVSFTLTGAVAGFQTFAVIGNGNTTYYSATDTSGNWEVGIGTYSSTGPTLDRSTILSSSNSGNAVTFSGAVNVFVTYPSSKSVNLNDSGNVSALGTVSSGTWQGATIGVAYGGTGVTASSGANSVVLRDANQNIAVNRLTQGSQTIVASGTTTVLTVASEFGNILTGTGGQTFKLPDATTLVPSNTFQFNNNATGTLTINDYGNTTIATVAPGGAAELYLTSNTTTDGVWDVHGYIPENVTWGTNALYLNSTVITGGTWNGGTITVPYGGTGLTTLTSNGALYATSSTTLTSGTLPVTSGGTGVSTIPSNGQLLIGNGTDYVVASLGAGTGISTTTGSGTLTVNNTAPMVYPGSGIPNSTGTAWGTSYTVSGSGTVVALATGANLDAPQFKAYKEAVETVGTVSAATYDINLNLANIFDITLGNNVTFTFTNPPASGVSRSVTVILRQDATGNRLATFTGANYSDGILPVLSTGSNQVDVLTFFTVDGGSFWFGTFAMANVS